mgnify:CR=1 FL=1
MFTKRIGAVLAVAALMATAAPIAAQGFSEGYQFLQAVKEADGNKVQDLLSKPGSLIHSRDRGTGDTALHIITRERNSDWMAFLVSKGAKVESENNQGETPLTLATQMGWTEGVLKLLSLRADVNQGNKRGETPLILAVQKRDIALVKLLLSRGADPKKADRVGGKSALDYARIDGRSAVILKALEEKPAATPRREAAGPSL